MESDGTNERAGRDSHAKHKNNRKRRNHDDRSDHQSDHHKAVFHSDLRSHSLGLPSYMLQDPQIYRRPSQNGKYYPGGPTSSDARDTSPPSTERRISSPSSRMEAGNGRHRDPTDAHHHHHRLGQAPFASTDLSAYLAAGAGGHFADLGAQPETGAPSLYPASLAATAPTAFAIDAETGRPVRILTHAGYGNPLFGGSAAPPSLYPSAAGPAGLSLYGGAFPGAAASAEALQRQTATLMAAAGGHNAVLVQRPGHSLPLYITDPLAPATDLGRPTSPPQDPYSFSSKVSSPSRGGLEELVARRRLEEEAMLRQQHHQQQQHQQQKQHQYHPLIGHVPSSQLMPSHHPLQQNGQNYQHSSRRSLPMHNGASPTPDYDDFEPPILIPQDLPDPIPGQFPAVLFCQADEERLTSYQCLLRKQLELFEANEEDVRYSTRQGRTAPIKLGQVGVRCRHCSGLNLSARTKGASYYSQTIEGIYQICQNMSKCHLCDKCVRVPRDIRRKLNIYRTDCRRAIKGKEYWSEHIRSLGVYEDPVDGCLRVRRPNDPQVRAAVKVDCSEYNREAKKRKIMDAEPEDDGVASPVDKVKEEEDTEIQEKRVVEMKEVEEEEDSVRSETSDKGPVTEADEKITSSAPLESTSQAQDPVSSAKADEDIPEDSSLVVERDAPADDRSEEREAQASVEVEVSKPELIPRENGAQAVDDELSAEAVTKIEGDDDKQGSDDGDSTATETSNLDV